jgi:deoxyribodipyrimidine photo-lyase
VAETGAGGVWWSRLYDPASVARDSAREGGAERPRGSRRAVSPGHLLHEPWEVETGQGGFYRVFTPYWRAVRAGCGGTRGRSEGGRGGWPRLAGLASDRLEDWHLGAAMNRGAEVVARLSGGG